MQSVLVDTISIYRLKKKHEYNKLKKEDTQLWHIHNQLI